MKLRYIIYGLLGWCVEIFWTGFGSFILNGDITLHGQTNIWMFFIYGLMIFLEPIHNAIRHCPVFIRGGVYTLLIFFTEYSTGTLLSYFIGVSPWLYPPGPYTINGLIKLDYSPYWFIFGLLFEIIHDKLVSLYNLKSLAKVSKDTP